VASFGACETFADVPANPLADDLVVLRVLRILDRLDRLSFGELTPDLPACAVIDRAIGLQECVLNADDAIAQQCEFRAQLTRLRSGYIDAFNMKGSFTRSRGDAAYLSEHGAPASGDLHGSP